MSKPTYDLIDSIKEDIEKSDESSPYVFVKRDTLNDLLDELRRLLQ